METLQLTGDFAIEFSTNEFSSQSPAQYFDGVSNMLDALQTLDANLVAFVLPNARAIQRIERVTTGSISLRIASLVEGIPEEDLRGLDWKRICGHFLVEGRKRILRWLRKQPKIQKPEQIEILGAELDQLAAEATGINRRISRRLLLSIVIRVIRGTQALPGNETVTIRLDGEQILLPREAEIPSETAQAVAEAELEPFEQEMRLLVKKPDMIGKSQWDFLERGYVIRAKMSDTEWVNSYQHNELTLRPGDAIDAKVRLTPKHDTSEQVYSYEIVKVRAVIPTTVTQQAMLFDSSGEQVN